MIMITCMILGACYQIMSSIYNIFTNKGLISVYNLLVDSWLMILILLLPILSCCVLKERYEDFLTIILYITSAMFCRVVIQLQCDIVGKQQFNNRFIFVSLGYTLCIVVLLVYELCNICLNTFIFNLSFGVIFIVLLGSLSHFLYDAIETMTSFLGIKFLTITAYEPTPDINSITTTV